MKSTHAQLIALFTSAGHDYPEDAVDTVNEHVEEAINSKARSLVKSAFKAMKTLKVFDRNLSGHREESYEVENVTDNYEWGTVWYGMSVDYPEKVGFRSRVKMPDFLRVAAQGVVDAYKRDRDLKVVDAKTVLQAYRTPQALKELEVVFLGYWNDWMEDTDFDRFEATIDGNLHDIIMEDSSSTFHPNEGPERDYHHGIDTALNFQYEAQNPVSEFKGKDISILMVYEVDLRDIHFDGEWGFDRHRGIR